MRDPSVNMDIKLCDRNVMFFDKVIVNAEDVCTAVNKCVGVNSFQNV